MVTTFVRKRGRPRLPSGEKKLDAMGFRPTPKIRAKLEKAARENSRSLSREIESRLEHTFLSEDAKYDALGGEHVYALMRLLGATVSLIEAGTGKRWQEDQETYDQVRGTIGGLFDGLGSQIPAESHDEALIAKAEVLSDALTSVILEGEAARAEGAHKTAMALLNVVSDLWAAMDSDQEWLDVRARLVRQYGAEGPAGYLASKADEG